METDAVEAKLEHSRAQIRAMLLLPDPATGQLDDNVFPRSAVMRFALDPRRRRMASAVVGGVGMMAARWGLSRGGVLAQITGSLFRAARR